MFAHIGVNFHYTGMPDFLYPGIYGYDTDTFRERIIELARHCQPVSLSAIFDTKLHGVPPNACLITFDDGLACQYNVALPILDELGYEAAYFVSRDVYTKQKGLHVHMVHWTRARLGDDYIREVIQEMFVSGDLSKNLSELDYEITRVCNPYDDPHQATLKYYLNYYLSVQEAERLLDRLMTLLDTTSEQFASEYYMSTAMLKELAERRMLGWAHMP